ncbi:hypothetical protein [Deinococcus sp. UYEF24]
MILGVLTRPNMYIGKESWDGFHGFISGMIISARRFDLDDELMERWRLFTGWMADEATPYAARFWAEFRTGYTADHQALTALMTAYVQFLALDVTPQTR